MRFRFRRSARLGPLRFNFSKAGLRSISVAGRGASFNIPVSRAGGARTTVWLPGTGLSLIVEHRPAQGQTNSRRLRSGQLEALKQELLALPKQPCPPGSSAAQLWEFGIAKPVQLVQHDAARHG